MKSARPVMEQCEKAQWFQRRRLTRSWNLCSVDREMFQSVKPRQNTARLEQDEKVPREVVERVKRIDGAHQVSARAKKQWCPP